MKLFKWIIITLIFALASVIGYQCIDTMSAVPFCFLIQIIGCGLLVMTDGWKKKNA